ncbi:MAG: type III-B CRISPR module-associated Cmr3 family protein [Opitutales bacterium]
MSKHSRTFELTPTDAWFFRDGSAYTHRPKKSEGESSDSSDDQSGVVSQFPPSAASVIGAVRAASALAMGWNGRDNWSGEIVAVLGDGPDDLGPLQFTGPFVARCGQPLFPLPLHVLGVTKENETFEPRELLRPQTGPGYPTDLGQVRLPVRAPRADNNPGEKLKTAENAFVTKDGLETILKGEMPSTGYVFLPKNLWSLESRVGLVRDRETHTVADEALYSPSFVRLHRGVSLVATVSGLPGDLRLTDQIPFGGESRSALIEEWDDPIALPASPPTPGKHQTVILLTPLPCPTSGGESFSAPGPGDELPGCRGVTVVSACVGKPVHYGGWDSRTNVPLPLRPHLPAGSVFFCECADYATLPERLGDRTAHGLGQYLTGPWPQ